MVSVVKKWREEVNGMQDEYYKAKNNGVFESIGPNAQDDLTVGRLKFGQTVAKMDLMFAAMKMILGICGVITGVFVDKLKDRIK